MSYFSTIEEGTFVGGLACGATCKCGSCRSGMSGFDEWYEKEEVDEPPKVTPSRVSSTRQSLHGLGEPKGPLPQRVIPDPRPERMPTNPVVPKEWCPELNKVNDSLCYPYSNPEIAVSWTEAGHLTPDVVLVTSTLGPGMLNTTVSCKYLIIRDFGVDWRHLKDSTINEQFFKDWITRFETDNSLLLRITGYSDCVGVERNNSFLRKGRALNVFNLLGPRARTRVMAVNESPPGIYLTDNSTVAARAKSRAVVIQVLTNSTKVI